MHDIMFSNYSTVFHILDVDTLDNGIDVRRLFTGLFISIYVYDSCDDVSNYTQCRKYIGFFSFSFILIIFFVVLLFFIEQFALTDPIQWADKGYEDGRNQFPKCPSKREKKKKRCRILTKFYFQENLMTLSPISRVKKLFCKNDLYIYIQKYFLVLKSL